MNATRTLLFVPLLLVAGCQLHEAGEYPTPDVAVPESYASGSAGAASIDAWWENYGDAELTTLVQEALSGNRDLGATWARLEQARQILRATDGADELQLDLNGGPSLSSSVVRSDVRSDRRDEVFGYGLGARASWALDLWGRIEARTKAAALDLQAAREDVSATAQLLAGAVVQAWLDLRLNESLLAIVAAQATTSQRLLDLTEFRFANGQGTALDVLQQRSQLAAVTSDLPSFEAARQAAIHRLAVLTGRVPGAWEPDARVDALPAPPPLPALLTPRDLLAHRPDLRAARARLEAADQRVAEAAAARLPDFTLSLDYQLTKGNGPGLFDREQGSLLLGVLAPILSGDRLTAEVERNRAVVTERLESFTALFLAALQEVEDAVVGEFRQGELVQNVERRVELAQATLAEAQARYGNGSGDFINVLTAVRTLQDVERLLVIEQRRLLAFRSSLHLALGGTWTNDLEAPATNVDEDLTRSES